MRYRSIGGGLPSALTASPHCAFRRSALRPHRRLECDRPDLLFDRPRRSAL